MLGAGREMGQGTVLGAGSVPDLRERWGRAQCLVLEERWGKAQCLVLEVCLTTERDGAGTVLGAGSVPHHGKRDRAGHSAWCWKCA